jgi:hypothetical protein
MGNGRGNVSRLDPGKVLFKRSRHIHTLRIRNDAVKVLLPKFMNCASVTLAKNNLFNQFLASTASRFDLAMFTSSVAI